MTTTTTTTAKTKNRDIRAFIRQNSSVAGAASRVAQEAFIACQGKIQTGWLLLLSVSSPAPFPSHSQRVNWDYAGGTKIFMARGHCVFDKNRKYEVGFHAEISLCRNSGRVCVDF